MEQTPPRTPARGILLRPGMKAFQTGVRHAFIAAGMKRLYEGQPSYPNKKTMLYNKNASKKSYIKKTVAKSIRKKTAATVKDTILGMAETYHDIQGDNVLFITGMDNATIYTNNVTAQVTQGNTIQGRQGDQIFLKGLNVKGTHRSAVASAPYTFRMLVLESGEEFDFGMSFGTTGLVAANIFQPGTGTNVPTSGIVNRKACNVLYDTIFDVNALIAGVAEIRTFDFYVPLNKKFKYQASGSEYGKTKNIYIVCIAYGNATDAGDVFVNTDLSFKNL